MIFVYQNLANPKRNMFHVVNFLESVLFVYFFLFYNDL
jgi:hypothetical protein